MTCTCTTLPSSRNRVRVRAHPRRIAQGVTRVGEHARNRVARHSNRADMHTKGYSERGASMGRGSGLLHTTTDRCKAYRVPLDEGGYDPGGAYWGGGRDTLPLYCVESLDSGDVAYVRARTLDAAKAQFPHARFGTGASFNREIVSAMARAAFVNEWANDMENRGKKIPNGDLMDVAPKRTHPSANKWARGVANTIVEQNGVKDMTALYRKAKTEYGYPHDADRFGHEIGMQAIGTGISWSDDAKIGSHDDIRVPQREYYR